MKTIDLYKIGVEELGVKETKETNGGFYFLILPVGLVATMWYLSSHPLPTDDPGRRR